MKLNRKIIMILGLVWAAAACQPQFSSTLTPPQPTQGSARLSFPSTTPSPNPTATPTPTPGGRLRLDLDFNEENQCVREYEDESGSGVVEEGVYRLRLDAANSLTFAPCETIVIGDLVLDVTVALAIWGATIRFGSDNNL